MEEQRRAELEERQRAMAMAKVQEEAEGRRIAEELGVARHKAVLAAAEMAVEESKLSGCQQCRKGKQRASGWQVTAAQHGVLTAR